MFTQQGKGRRTAARQKLRVLALAWATLGAAGAATADGAPLATHAAAGKVRGVEDTQWVGHAPFWPQADRLVASKREGFVLLDAQGQVLARQEGTFDVFAHRAGPEGLLAAVVERNSQQVVVLHLAAGQKEWRKAGEIPRTPYKVNGICLYQDAGHSLFAFLVGEEGIGEQWLIAQNQQPLARPRPVRRLSLPPQSEYCAVDDGHALLYVNEEKVGLWAYDADAEADLVRRPVDLVEPFGSIAKAVAGVAAVPGGVLALDPKKAVLHSYAYDGKRWQPKPAQPLEGAKEPEGLSIRLTGQRAQALLLDDDDERTASLAWDASAALAPPAPLPVIAAQVQTELVPSLGDAADDPAIWLHPRNPAQSRILGTDKQGGLLAYDLNGKQLQDLRAGRLNNVDVRAGLWTGKGLIDVAVASNRDHNSLQVFGIDRDSGELEDLGEIATPLEDIYGLCLFKNGNGRVYAIVNDKDGTFLQYHVTVQDGRAAGTLARQFRLASQPEGCVADDRTQRLFVGEENEAVWALDARAEEPARLQPVIRTGEVVHADVEGLAIYSGANSRDYLVISSQGNDSYVVLDAAAPYAVRGAFRIGLNAGKGIDGASETDGLEVTSANLGGIWSQGMLVVQDGRKRMPEGNQNFKAVPWSAIAEALKLE